MWSTATKNNQRRQQQRKNRKICPRLIVAICIYGLLYWMIFQIQMLTSSSLTSSVSQQHHFTTDTMIDAAKTNELICKDTRLHLEQGGKVLLYNFTSASNGPGMASLTLNMLQIAMYFQERWNRTYTIIDEAQLMNYRWDDNHGLFHGYLDYNGCILSEENRHSVLSSSSNICGHWDMKCQSLEIPADPQGAQFEKARRIIKRYYFQKKEKLDHEPADILRTRFFQDLSKYTCSQMSAFRLRRHVDELVKGILETSQIPIHEMDLALHIRRGDKVAGSRKESRIYHADEYLERFFNQSSSSTTPANMKHCFVATDDYNVITEVKDALNRYHIPCTLWTLTPPGYESSWQARDEILGFLAQIRILVNAKHFVGSFSSNVGGLVALLRGCHLGLKEHRGDESNRFHHYFESYGVDWDEWGFL